MPDAAGALAQATRAFRAGSYTDGEPPANDETTKALQAIAKSRLTSKEDALAQERGKLASIGRSEERLVFLLRGCDTLKVMLCPGRQPLSTPYRTLINRMNKPLYPKAHGPSN